MLAVLLAGRLLWALPAPPLQGKLNLTVERMMSGEYSDQGPEDVGEWRPDGKHIVSERPSKTKSDAEDIVLVDPATGKATVVVPADLLVQPGSGRPLPLEQFWLSPDAKHLLIFNNSKRVWRQHTRGDFWALDVTSGKLIKLGGNAEASSLMFAKLSPDGAHAGYVYKNNVYVEDLQTAQITPLTKDGGDTLINGTSDWVYEEELDIRDGWRWSPDGKSIAFYQVDSSLEPLYTLINDTDSLYPKVKQFPYPKTGQTNPTVRIGVVPARGGAITWMKDVATTTNGYIARMEWAPNSQSLLTEHLNRLQNANQYLLSDVSTGESHPIFTDSDPTWVDVLDTEVGGARWIDGAKKVLVSSERDGWRHLYAASANGGAAVLLTRGAFDVDNVVGVDEEAGWVYFMASPDNSTQRYLFRTNFRNVGTPTRATPAGEEGTNSYEISPDGKLAFHTVSQYTEPPSTELIALPSHTQIRKLSDNEDLKNRLSTLRLGTSKFLQLTAADGSKMDAHLLLPPDFDAAKKYPVLFNVYGEPAGAIVQDDWGGGHLFDELIAERGYIVAAVDNRGTPALKGRPWRKSVYRKIGITASEDQAAAAKQLDALPYVDPSRIGIWGWSGGGTMTLNMLFRYPELYRLGMSVAPVPDMRLYDTIYQERYMGLPAENEKDYLAGSPITYAEGLRGALLIVHGSGDDNVHYQGTERLINKLVALGKPFQMMVYPNRTHDIAEGPGTRLHLYNLLLRFLTTNMPP